MSSATALLRDLVAIPSVSSLSNRPIIDYLQRFFTDLNWHQRVLSYIDAQGVEKRNLIVSPQPFAEETVHTELAIVCHTDTVPFSDTWLEATRLQERDGMLHGCGACDVKGFLACMLSCAAMLDASNIHRRVCFVFTADEEIGCKGARFLLQEKALTAKYAIVGEPTSLLPARAGKGYGLAEVTVHGKSAHSSYPEAGCSAILAAARYLRELEDLEKLLQTERNETFSPPWTTLNVGVIHGGAAKNIVPAECSFLVEWRPIPSQDAQFVAGHLRRIAAEIATGGIRVDVTVTRSDPGFETSADSPVIRAVLPREDAAALSVPFGTEAPWLTLMGAEAVVIGPGSMLTAHSPRECVPIRELDDCVRTLHTAIERLCVTT